MRIPLLLYLFGVPAADLFGDNPAEFQLANWVAAAHAAPLHNCKYRRL